MPRPSIYLTCLLPRPAPPCPTEPAFPPACLKMEDFQAAQSWSSCLPETHSARGHHSNHPSPTRLGRQKVIPGKASPAANAGKFAVEEVRSCSSKRSRGEEDSDDGLRQFKRQLTECFFNFMRSDQPKQMYDLALALRNGSLPEATERSKVSLTSVVPLDSTDSQRSATRETDDLHDVEMRYSLTNEWEMCVELSQQVKEVQSPRGRQHDEASEFVPRVFLRPRVDPQVRRSPEQVNMEAGNCQAIKEGSGDCSPIKRSLCPQEDKTIFLQTSTGLPVCRLLNSLRQQLLAEVDPRLEVYGQVNSPGSVPSRTVGGQGFPVDWRTVQAEELQSLYPLASCMSLPSLSLVGGRGNDWRNMETQEILKVTSAGQKDACLPVVKDATRALADLLLPPCLRLSASIKLNGTPFDMDRGSCQGQEHLEAKVVAPLPSPPSASKSQCLETSAFTCEGTQPLQRIQVAASELEPVYSSFVERSSLKGGDFSSSCHHLLCPFRCNNWVDKSLLAKKDRLSIIDGKSHSFCLFKHQDFSSEIHNLLSCGSWLTELLDSFFGQIGEYRNVFSNSGTDKRSDSELRVSLFEEAIRNHSFAGLLENLRKYGGNQINGLKPASAPVPSPDSQSIEAYNDSGRDSYVHYSDVKVYWTVPAMGNVFLKKCSYPGIGSLVGVRPEELEKGRNTEFAAEGPGKSAVADCSSFIDVEVTMNTESANASPGRSGLADSGNFVKVEVVSAVEMSRPSSPALVGKGKLEDRVIPQDTDCSSCREHRRHERCTADHETQVYDHRFILVDGIAPYAEAETSKDSDPHSSSPDSLPHHMSIHGTRDRNHIAGIHPFSQATRYKTPPRLMRTIAAEVSCKVDDRHPHLKGNTKPRTYYEEGEDGELRILHDNCSISSDTCRGNSEQLSMRLDGYNVNGFERASKSRSFLCAEKTSKPRPVAFADKSKRQQQMNCHEWATFSGQSRNRSRDQQESKHPTFDYRYVKDERDVQRVRDVKRERDIKSSEMDSGVGPLLIVLSDSSDDDSEDVYRSSIARNQSVFQKSKQVSRMYRRPQELEKNMNVTNERHKRLKCEKHSDTDLHFRNVKNSCSNPTRQLAEHDLKGLQTFRETPVAGRSGWLVEKKQGSQQHPTRFVSEERKWTAGITCDLCGRGPSLACGEWYAWCCGKMKSSCLCPPQRRSIKLPQKSSKALPRVVNGYVHRMCAIWSAEVVEQNDHMQDLASAVRRGLSLKCAYCQKFGATLGCRVGKCRKSFHYPCADFLASRLQLRMWEGCTVAIACKEHQHIDSVCEAPTKLSAELRSSSNSIGYLGSNLVCEDLSNNQEAVQIPCTNDVDDEPLPQIKYITKCRYNRMGGVMREGMCPGKAKLAKGCQGCTQFDLDDPFAAISVHLPKTKSRCSDIRTDWQHQPMYGRLAYDEFGRLQLGADIIDVVECNIRCKCGSNCKNRVLQNGLQVRLEVFRTRNRGWGVRTLDDLPRGTFVVEYVGELLTHDEADVRGQQYDAMNHSCLFNMDHPDVPQDEILVLDGYSMSNVARFVNHSCDGNLVVCRVYTESTEPKFCRIGLYTNRDIWAGTELCYDYSYNTKDLSKEDLQRVLRHPETIRCRCGSSNCRKVLWRGGS